MIGQRVHTPDEQMAIDHMFRLCVVAVQGSCLFYVELWDKEGLSIPFKDASGKLWPSISLSIGTSPASWPYLSQLAGYNVGNYGLPQSPKGADAGPDEGPIAGGVLRLDLTSQGAMGYNFAGDGAQAAPSPNGIDPTRAGPVAGQCPRILLPSALTQLYFGKYWSPNG